VNDLQRFLINQWTGLVFIMDLTKSRERFAALSNKSMDWFSFYNGFLEGYMASLTKKRTNKQNAALHKFFNMLSDQLNELGQTFHYSGFKGEDMELMFTETIIKEFLWKPIQKALFDTDSTTKLTTDQINKILDVITNFYANKGIPVVFPSKAEQLLNM